MNKSVANYRVTRWLLLLKEFDITIIDKPGKDNVVSNFLSQLTNDGEAIHVEDHFLDDHLFVISTNVPWYTNIAHYLVAGELPYHLSPRRKKWIVRQSS